MLYKLKEFFMKGLPCFAFLWALLFVGAYGNDAAPEPAVAVSESQLNEALKPDPQMLCGTLDNGLRYVIRPTKEPAGQVSLRLFVEVGSLNETPETSGISHFVEHMVFNGSRHFKRGELIPAMQSIGLGIGNNVNAFTTMLHTTYMLDIPANKPDSVKRGFTILRDFADGATMDDQAIEHERGIIVSELKEQDSASYRADIEIMRKLVGGTRVPEYSTIGKEEVIRNCPAETIRRYYRDNYVASRMTVVITGDIEPKLAQQYVSEHFSSMQKRPAPTRPAIGTPTDMNAGSFIIPNPELANGVITLAVVNPWERRPDTLKQRVADLPLELACSILNGRLSLLANQADSPFITASVIPKENVYEAANLFALRIVTAPDQWKQGLAAAEAELRRAIRYGFSATELNEAIAAIKAATQKKMQTWGHITAGKAAAGIVASLGKKTLFTAPQEDARAYIAGIREIVANPDLCRKALEKAYEANRARLILSGKAAADATPQSLAAAYAAARSQEVSPMKEEKLSAFAYEQVGEPGKLVDRTDYGDLGVTALRFGNGVRVNLKPMGAGMGRVYVTAAVDGGALRLPQTPGLVEMVEAVMPQGGLEAHSVAQLGRMFAGKQIQCSFGMDAERFSFSACTSPQDLELQCKVLCAAIMHPGYRREGEMQLRRALPTYFRGLETSAQGAFGILSAKSIFGDDARFLMPSMEQLSGVDAAAVKKAVAPFLKNGALEVAVVGDFKVADILPVLERTFGAMPQRNPEFSAIAPGARSVKFQPWGKHETLRYNSTLDKTVVACVRYAGNGRDLKRNRRMAIIQSILSGRLFAAIRAELGEGYAPGVQYVPRQSYDNAATITAMSPGVTANCKKVAVAMKDVFDSLANGDITEEEFRQIMKPFLADADMALRKPTFWVGSLARLQSEARTLEFLRNFRKDAESITVDEIRALTREVFGNNNANYYLTVPQSYREAQ